MLPDSTSPTGDEEYNDAPFKATSKRSFDADAHRGAIPFPQPQISLEILPYQLIEYVLAACVPIDTHPKSVDASATQ